MLRSSLLKTQRIFLVSRTRCQAMEVQPCGEKRELDSTGLDEANKKVKTSDQQEGTKQGEGRLDRKRKCALLISYNGKGYYGLQINPGFRTIESDLCKALLECGLIPQEHHDCMQKMSFQRAARTDKGVSAAGNVISLKIRHMLLNAENLVDKINEKLPPQIRVMDYVRTTNSFNSKNFCDARTYIYVMPTYAFSPLEEMTTLDYRVDMATIEKVNEVLEKYIGTHNFHNFTSGVKPTEQSANRYILQFECRKPFVRDGMEFCVLSVKGQSFMLHQIRKMIGLMIAVVKGFCDIDVIQQAWQSEKVDVPIAPGLGLVLEKLHYKRYNERFGSDGLHKKIEWSHIKEKLDTFQEEQIFAEIIKEELKENSMMNWLPTLFKHGFGEDMLWHKRKQLHDGLASAESGTVAGSSAGNDSEKSTGNSDTIANQSDGHIKQEDTSDKSTNGNEGQTQKSEDMTNQSEAEVSYISEDCQLSVQGTGCSSVSETTSQDLGNETVPDSDKEKGNSDVTGEVADRKPV